MLLPKSDSVSATPLREAFLLKQARGETSGCSAALEMGWTKVYRQRGEDHIVGDKSRLYRFLGLRECHHPDRKRVSYDGAVLFARALDIDPVDLEV